jgi:hypothetical protein
MGCATTTCTTALCSPVIPFENGFLTVDVSGELIHDGESEIRMVMARQ